MSCKDNLACAIDDHRTRANNSVHQVLYNKTKASSSVCYGTSVPAAPGFISSSTRCRCPTRWCLSTSLV
jgi:hypothetical protein